jgi:prepilin-type N-terminal cleavage/methylation domain-containing protein
MIILESGPQFSRHRRAGNRGFTLTEIAIVLGIISIILAAIWVASGQVNEKSRITQAMNEFGAVSQSMTSMFQGGYGTSATPCAAPCNVTSNMISSGVIPQWMVSGTTGTTAMHPWSSTGFFVYWMGTTLPGALPSYRMSYYNVSHDGCLGLIMQTTNCTPNSPGCPFEVSSGGTQPAATAFAAPTYTQSMTTAAITTAQAETICGKNTYPTGANSVEFDFSQ